MWIFIIIVLIVIILVAVVKNDNKQIQIDNLQNGGFRKSYPLFTKHLEDVYGMSFYEDFGNSFSYSKTVLDENNQNGTLYVGLKLNTGREPIIHSSVINFNGVKFEGSNVIYYNIIEHIETGIIASIEKLTNNGVLLQSNILLETKFGNESGSNVIIKGSKAIIHVENFGDLSKLIPSGKEKIITHLKLTGQINTMDLWILRIMGGGVDFASDFNLKELDLSDVSIENGLIKDLSFYKCLNITHVVTPHNLSIIEEGAFSGCENLREIVLGGDFLSIHKNGFSNCKSLNSISILCRELSVGDSAFSNCSNLLSIYIKKRIPPIISDHSLRNILYDKVSLYVPNGKIGVFQSDSSWNRFKKMKEFEFNEAVMDTATINPKDIKSKSEQKNNLLEKSEVVIEKKTAKLVTNIASNNQNTVTDIDGNIYKTVQIGKQVWMAENLKVSRYRNGDLINKVENQFEWALTKSNAFCFYDNNPVNISKHGYLYNWFVVKDSRNIAPMGWHIPNDNEWTTLENYLISNGYNFNNEYHGDNKTNNKIAKALSSENGWKDCSSEGACGNNLRINNQSGFNAFPTGSRYDDGSFDFINQRACWWSSTDISNNVAWMRSIEYNHCFVERDYNGIQNGYSIRCVKDSDASPIPIKTRSLKEFSKEIGATNLSVFRSKKNTLYLAENNTPNIFVAHVSELITCKDDVKNPTISTYLDNKGIQYHVLHNA